jgi:arylsulfatase A-like enzyme
VVMPDIIENLCQFVESKRGEKWMAYLHIMDVHDCRGFNRPLTVIARWRFLPRWWAGRIRGYTDRRFAYDTALMSVDANVGKLLKAIERSGQADNLLFLVTGDHGSFYARSPRIQKGVIATRTHFEDIETPMIISGAKPPPTNDGLIDSMGLTATLLDALGVEPHPSFKGISAYAGGREAIITESCGHGAADLARRDIHFTVTTKTHRMMTTLSGAELSTSELYDIKADPKEVINLASDPESGPVIAALMDHIYRERAELLALRGINMEGAAAQL